MGGEAGRNPGLAPRAVGATEGVRAAGVAGVTLAAEGQVGSCVGGGSFQLLAAVGRSLGI